MPTAGEFCNQHVIVARPGEPLLDVASRMRDEHVGSVVVVDDGRRRPIGMLTDRDIVVGVLARTDRHLHSVLVGDVMSSDPITASASEDMEAVVKRMRTAGVRRLPVVDRRGSLVGVIAFDDVVGYLQEQLTDLTALMAKETRQERAGHI